MLDINLLEQKFKHCRIKYLNIFNLPLCYTRFAGAWSGADLWRDLHLHFSATNINSIFSTKENIDIAVYDVDSNKLLCILLSSILTVKSDGTKVYYVAGVWSNGSFKGNRIWHYLIGETVKSYDVNDLTLGTINPKYFNNHIVSIDDEHNFTAKKIKIGNKMFYFNQRKDIY